MAEDTKDTLARAYATLKSLRNNIAEMNAVTEIYVSEFHTVLTRLQGTGINVSEFWIPDSEIAPRVTVIRTLTFADSPKSRADYSREKYVDKSFILMKIDTVLGYFEIITSEKPKKMGFYTPSNK